MTAPFFPRPLSPAGRCFLFEHEAQSCLLGVEGFGKAKAQSVPHSGLTPPLLTPLSTCSSCLALPVSENQHSDTYTSAADTTRWDSLPTSYLLCHFKPLQQSHKFLLEVWLLKQNKGRKKISKSIKPCYKMTNIQATVALFNMPSAPFWVHRPKVSCYLPCSLNLL